MANQPIAKVEIPPVTVRSGDRVSTIPTWPMPLEGVEARSIELESDEGDVLVLGPKRRAWWKDVVTFASGLSGAGLTMALLYQELRGFDFVIWGIGLLLIFGLIGLVFLHWISAGVWVRLDRRSGLISWSRRPFGLLRAPRAYQSVPLSEVVCIQLIYNGFHSTTEEIGDGDRKTYQVSRFHAYQMNLVFEGDSPTRVNLAHHSDWQWMRYAGGQLAEYLEVPLVDQLHHG